MNEGNPTTVNLTKSAQKVKNQLSPIYGLKNILSAGLLLFGDLPREKRESAIARANGLSAEDIVFAAEEDSAKKKRSRRRKDAKSG